MKPLLPLLAIALFAAPALRAELPSLAVPGTATPPAIDGDLTDAAWAAAGVIGRMLPPSGSPADAGVPAPLPTTVRVLWDSEALYVAFACEDSDVLCSGTFGHDGDLYREDVVEVFLDVVGDARSFLEIEVAPDGTTLDLLHLYTAEPKPLPDGRIRPEIVKTDRWSLREWELTGLSAAARCVDGGWQAELLIPVAPLLRRLGRDVLAPGMVIRAQFVRYDHDGDTLYQQTWSPCVPGNPHNCPSLFGILRLCEEHR